MRKYLKNCFVVILLIGSFLIGYWFALEKSKIIIINQRTNSKGISELSVSGEKISNKHSLFRLDRFDKDYNSINPYITTPIQYTLKADGLYFRSIQDAKPFIMLLDKDFIINLSYIAFPEKDK